jgi:hypothetical protein
MTPHEYAVMLAEQCGPLADWQIEGAARILASVELEQVAA